MDLRDKNTGTDPLLTALVVLCQYHQIDAHPDALISGLPLQDGKLRPDVFSRAARRANFHSKIAKTDLNNLNQDLLPAIILLNNNQCCVLKSIIGDSCEVIFPELPTSEIEVNLEKIIESYTGYVIYARPDALDIRDSSLFDSDQEGHWFWAVIRKNKALYKDILAAAVVINLMAIAMPMFIMNIYDRVVPNSAFATLWVLAIGMLLLISADLALKLLRTWFVDLAANRTDIQLSSKIMSHSLAISLDKKPNSSGTIISAVQSFEAVRSFISSLTLTALADLPFVLLFIIIIALIHWTLVIPIIVGSILILLYALISQHNMRTLAKNGMEFSVERSNILLESLSDLETVKSFNLQSKIQSRWEKLTVFISTNSAKMRFLSASVTQVAAWIQQLSGIAIVIVGVYQISHGNLSQGGLIAAYMLSTRALMPVSQSAALIAQFHQASTAMETLEKIMEIPQESNPANIKINHANMEGNIELRNVSFSYQGSDIQTLSKINLKIKSGEHIAILGRNGSGKSTIEKLILGIYEPTEGSVFIDDINLKQIDKKQLRQCIGYVPQDINLINGTLKSNVVSACNDYSDEHIFKTLQQVELSSLIHSHPKGILLAVGERGSNLSGGQKQAVGIARAIIGEPSIYIFDEPTSALDHTSEEAITNRLEELTKNKTLILITHRGALLKLAQRLVVIDQGKIVADGPKDVVMEALRQGRITGAS